MAKPMTQSAKRELAVQQLNHPIVPTTTTLLLPLLNIEVLADVAIACIDNKSFTNAKKHLKTIAALAFSTRVAGAASEDLSDVEDL